MKTWRQSHHLITTLIAVSEEGAALPTCTSAGGTLCRGVILVCGNIHASSNSSLCYAIMAIFVNIFRFLSLSFSPLVGTPPKITLDLFCTIPSYHYCGR